MAKTKAQANGGERSHGFLPGINQNNKVVTNGVTSGVTNGVTNGLTNGGHTRAAPANLVLPRPPAGAVSGSNPAHYTFYRSEGRGYKADNGPRAHSLPSRIGNGAGSGEVRKPPRGASSAGKPPARLAPLPKLANWTMDDRKGHRAPHPHSSLTGTHQNTHAGVTTKDHENHLSRQQKFASAWAQARAENHVDSPVTTARGSESSSPRRAEQEAAEQRKARAANTYDRTSRSKSEPAPADRSVQVRPSRPPAPEPRSTGPAKSPDKAKSLSPSRVPASQDGRRKEEVKVVERKPSPDRATARRIKSSIKFNDRVVVLGEKDRSPSTDRRTHQPAASPRTERAPPAEEERVVPPYHPAITDPHVIYRTYTGHTKRELQLQRIEQQEAEDERARRAEVGSQYSRSPRSVSRMGAQDRRRKRAVLREGEARLYLSARSVYKGDGFRQQRKSRFLHRLEEVQKEMRKCQTEEEKQRFKLWNESRQRQKNQLLGVRRRFQKEQVQRFRTQYVTSRVLEHEHANRHNYGLPEDFNDSGVDDDEDSDDDYYDDDDSEGSGGRNRRGKSSKRRTKTRRRVPTEADTARTRRKNERMFDVMFNSNRGPAWDRAGTPKMEGIDFVTIDYTDHSGRNVRRKREASDFVRDAEELLNGDDDDLRLSREPTPSPFTSPRSSKRPRAQASRTQTPTHRRGSASTQRTAGRRRRPSESSKPPRHERPPWNMRPDPKHDAIARKPEPRQPRPKSDLPSSSNKTAVTQGDNSPANSKPPVTSSTTRHRSDPAPKSHGDSRAPPGKPEHNNSEKPSQQTDNSAMTKGDRGERSSSRYPAKSQSEPKTVNTSKDDKHLKESDKGHQKPDDTPKQDSVGWKRSAPASSSEKPDRAADKKESRGAGESKETNIPPKTLSYKDNTDPGKSNVTQAARSKGLSDSSEDKNNGKVSKEPEKPTVKSDGASQRERTEAKPAFANKQTANSPNATERQAAKLVDSNKQTQDSPRASEKQAMKPAITSKQAEDSPHAKERQAAKPVVTNKQPEVSPNTRERQAAKPVSDNAVKPKPNSTRMGVDASKQDSKPRDSQTTTNASKQAQDLPYTRQTPSRGAQARDERRAGPRYVVRPKSRNLQSRPRVNSDKTSKTNKPEPPVRDSKGAKTDQDKATKAKPADQNRPDRRRRVSDRTASKQSERPGVRRGGEGGRRQPQREEAPRPKAAEVKKPALDISNRSKRKAPAPAAAPLYFDDSDDDDDDDDDVDIFERARLKYGLVIESDDDDDDLFDKSRR